MKQHDGKHMTGDRMKILMLNLPFLMQDLLRSEIRYIDIMPYIGYKIVQEKMTKKKKMMVTKKKKKLKICLEVKWRIY